MYRILMPLDAKKFGCLEPGALSFLEWLKAPAIRRLIDCGAIAPVAPPPLAVLPKWVTRAEKLAPLGILTVVDLLRADSDELRQAFNYKRVATIEGWKREARTFIETPPERKPRR